MTTRLHLPAPRAAPRAALPAQWGVGIGGACGYTTTTRCCHQHLYVPPLGCRVPLPEAVEEPVRLVEGTGYIPASCMLPAPAPRAAPRAATRAPSAPPALRCHRTLRLPMRCPTWGGTPAIVWEVMPRAGSLPARAYHYTHTWPIQGGGSHAVQEVAQPACLHSAPPTCGPTCLPLATLDTCRYLPGLPGFWDTFPEGQYGSTHHTPRGTTIPLWCLGIPGHSAGWCAVAFLYLPTQMPRLPCPPRLPAMPFRVSPSLCSTKWWDLTLSG